MIDEFFRQVLGVSQPKKKGKSRGKSRKGGRSHTDYMNSYSYKMDKKARKEMEEAYGKLSADIFFNK